jgi:hypothetical protein
LPGTAFWEADEDVRFAWVVREAGLLTLADFWEDILFADVDCAAPAPIIEPLSVRKRTRETDFMSPKRRGR